MPNHCTNQIKVTGPEETVNEFYKSHLRTVEVPVRGSETETETALVFDFNDFIPMPASLKVTSGTDSSNAYDVYYSPNGGSMLSYKWIAEKGIKTLEELRAWADKEHPDWQAVADVMHGNIEAYGAANWYDWCCQNWGTKWNAYGVHCQTPPVADAEGQYYMEFCFTTAWSPPSPVLAAIAAEYPDLTFENEWYEEGGLAGYMLISEGGDIFDESDREHPYANMDDEDGDEDDDEDETHDEPDSAAATTAEQASVESAPADRDIPF